MSLSLVGFSVLNILAESRTFSLVSFSVFLLNKKVCILIDVEIDNEQDLQAKILEDKIYSTHKSLIEIYRSEIDDHVHRVVFEAYIDKGYITARAMAKYFDIPVTSAHYLIREIKQNLRKLQYRYETISHN